MGNDHSNDDWDQFDSAHWNVASDSDESGAADRPSSGDEDAHYSDGFLRPALAKSAGAAGWAASAASRSVMAR